jgi:flavin reductase (DIM6/NTAB) family NADH-FMN oxidoreductase RutF
MTNKSSTGTIGSAFAGLVAELDYPLYVVTTAVLGEPTGCLIGFATQCSIHPPRFLAGISKKNHTFQLSQRAAVFAVHVVDEGNKTLAELFGGETGDQVDKFARVRWHYVDGVPILDDCARWFTGRLLDRIDLGDHVGHLLEPLRVETGSGSAQLMYQQARDIEPGHEP